jgi:hypothetical protein
MAYLHPCYLALAKRKLHDLESRSAFQERTAKGPRENTVTQMLCLVTVPFPDFKGQLDT